MGFESRGATVLDRESLGEAWDAEVWETEKGGCGGLIKDGMNGLEYKMSCHDPTPILWDKKSN